MAALNQIQLRRGTESSWTSTNPVLSEGELSFTTDTGRLKSGDGTTDWVNLPFLGSKESLYTVRNETGSVLYAGQAIYASGIHANKTIHASLYVADGVIADHMFIGLVSKDISNNSFGYVTHFGQIDNLNTTGDISNISAGGETWSNGTLLYVSPTSAGKLTSTKPREAILVAIVLYAHATQGKLFVRPSWEPHLDDLHDVSTTGISSGKFLYYNGSTTLWEPNADLYGSSSNIGVGISNPSSRLVVKGSGTTSATSSLNITNSSDSSLLFVRNDGFVGIGTSSPGSTLDVRGSAVFNEAGGNFDFRIEGDTDANLFFVDASTDRIGIGTNSPTNNLSIVGTENVFSVTGDDLTYGGQPPTSTIKGYTWFGKSDGSVGIGAHHADNGTFGSSADFFLFEGFDENVTAYTPICLAAGYDPQLFLDTSLNVGIGTANPSAKLDVNGTAVFGTDSLGRIKFGEDTFGGELGFYDNNDQTLALRFSDGSFQYGGGAPGNANLVVTSSGNVGIGTTAPESKLHVTTNFSCGTNPQAGNAGMYVDGDTGSVSITDNGPQAIAVIDANGGLTLYGNGGAGGTEILSTDRTNLRIGIGTIAPSSTLHVVGDTNIDGNLTFDSFTESVVSNGNSGTSKTLSLASGTVHTCTLTGNCTFTMPAATAGKSFTMFLNTGSGNYTASFSGVRWSDSTAPTITSTASKVDLLSFISDGTYWYGSFSQNYG